jgi:ATP-binding cassette subfamily B protein
VQPDSAVLQPFGRADTDRRKDIRTLTQKSLRDNIGVVQQYVYMFSGTVYDNIAYGLPSATRRRSSKREARGRATPSSQSFPRLPDLRRRARVKLSGGQKQRISIARVFLKNRRS